MLIRRTSAILFCLLVLAISQSPQHSFADPATAVISDVSVDQASVAPGAQFTVTVKIAYDFGQKPYEIRVAVTDPTTGLSVPGGEFKFDQLTKSGERSYVFNQLRAPPSVGPWNLKATVEYSSIQANQVFAHGTKDWSRVFTVNVAEPRHVLTVKLVPEVTFKVDEVAVTSDAFGIGKVGSLAKGPHTVEVQSTIAVDDGVRYAFKNWQDGDNSNPRTVNLLQDMLLEAVYEKQYYLTVESPYGETSGTGWYAENSVATISVDPTSVPMEGVFGFLGARTAFSAWTGDIRSELPTVPVRMDGQKSVAAEWSSDMWPLYLNILLVILVVAIATIAVLLLKRRRKPPATPLITGTGYLPGYSQPGPGPVLSLKVQAAPVAYCQKCGAALPTGAAKCPACGGSAKK